MSDIWPAFTKPRHTLALKYSARERLVCRLTGRWPDSVVDRRMAALEADERELAAEIEAYKASKS